ncbi:MAG: lycopene cyclase protein [Actinotalea sp.]|nr:lycopene cyclase protein [Actinotalea sp.]
MSVAYAVCLLVSIGCMALLDHRFRLFFFDAPARAAVVLVAGVGFFSAWDLVGIALGLFLRGDSPYMTGLLVAPEMPVEELGFLTLLCYLTMNLYVALRRRLDRSRADLDLTDGRVTGALRAHAGRRTR